MSVLIGTEKRASGPRIRELERTSDPIITRWHFGYAFCSKTRHSPQSAHPESDISTFGSFAEIGAGQEVAHWFLLVGGASGTVAKTISAYDKEVSDDLYGSGSRYVSRQRLEAMLDNEWTQLLTQLSKTRGPQTRFFSFVDTVSARNFAGTNDPHGWIGLRFQLQPGGPPNDILLHINMRDSSNVLQQEAIGILGVNLIYAAFYEVQTEESFLAGLAQDVVKERIEIDYVDLRGPAFESWDRRALLAHWSCRIRRGCIFPFQGPHGSPYRGSLQESRRACPGIFWSQGSSLTRRFICDVGFGNSGASEGAGRNKVGARRLFLPDGCSVTPDEPAPEIPDLLRRIDALLAAGGDVLLFRQRELYHMTALVNRYTQAPVRFAAGLSLMIRAFEDIYGNLEGRLLEALARLFAQNVRIYAYPMTAAELRERLKSVSVSGWEWSETNGLVSASQLRHAPPLGHLFAYLLASNFLVPMQAPVEA